MCQKANINIKSLVSEDTFTLHESESNAIHNLRLLSKFKVRTYGLLTKCEVKMVGHWPSSFFYFLFFFAWFWTKTESRSVNSQKRTRPISSDFDRTILAIKRFITWLSGKFFSRDTAGSPERAR